MSETHLDDKPPLFPSWRRWYWFVLGVLAAQVIAYYWITQSFS